MLYSTVEWVCAIRFELRYGGVEECWGRGGKKGGGGSAHTHAQVVEEKLVLGQKQNSVALHAGIRQSGKVIMTARLLSADFAGFYCILSKGSIQKCRITRLSDLNPFFTTVVT